MTAVTIIIVVLVLLALGAAAYAMTQKQRREQLRTRLGPEYDRQVDAADGNRRQAEQHLAGVVRERDKLEIRDLDETERARYSQEWDVVQARFVDEPTAAVDAAETLITTVMRERGYPVEHDFDDRADLVAVDHPDVVSHYREAHAAHERHRQGGGLDTEDLRQSFVHYRELFTVLVHPQTAGTANPAARPTSLDEDAETRTGTVGARREADAAAEHAAAKHSADGRATDGRATDAPVTDAPVTDAEGRPVTDTQGRPITDADFNHPQETR